MLPTPKTDEIRKYGVVAPLTRKLSERICVKMKKVRKSYCFYRMIKVQGLLPATQACQSLRSKKAVIIRHRFFDHKLHAFTEAQSLIERIHDRCPN